MASLLKRIEIRIDERRLKVLESESQRQNKSIAGLVREAIDAKYRTKDILVADRLQAVDELGRIKAPVAEWEQMEDEVYKGLFK